mmetsp:Transcript_4196/g.6208  ORF Transcript_4196/g.6208 Transcript_4196/m.6208 type:complete len:403 (+) Transcript_4196:119-1327(+)
MPSMINPTPGNPGTAMLLISVAGLCTAFGAGLVFCSNVVRRLSRKVIAFLLSVSAGVLLYLAFGTILSESIDRFVISGQPDQYAFLYAVLCFFGGALIFSLIDVAVACCSKNDMYPTSYFAGPQQRSSESVTHKRIIPYCIGCSPDLLQELDEWKMRVACGREEKEKEVNAKLGRAEIEDNERGSANDPSFASNSKKIVVDGTHSSDPVEIEDGDGTTTEYSCACHAHETIENNDLVVVGTETSSVEDQQKVTLLGIRAVLALAVHNLPEGVAIYIGTLGSIEVGIALALAIGLHNIPLGLCVAIPVYNATGSRWKAFGMGLIPTFAQPLAGLIAYLALRGSQSDALYGTLYGFVAGLLTMTCVKEILPAANKYDPKDGVVTYGFICGMFLMSAALILLSLY